MKRPFYENPAVELVARMVDIFLLNVLWVLTSIPVITIGTSTTALYYCMLKILRKRDSGVLKMYFDAFFRNLRQGCMLTLLLFACSAFLCVDIAGCMMMDSALGNGMKLVLIFLLAVLGMVFSYVFPLLAQFDNSIKSLLKSAFFMSLTNLTRTIPIFLLNVIPFVLLLGYPYGFVVSVPVWLMFGVAVIALLNSKMLIGIFDGYIEAAGQQERGASGDEA